MNYPFNMFWRLTSFMGLDWNRWWDEIIFEWTNPLIWYVHDHHSLLSLRALTLFDQLSQMELEVLREKDQQRLRQLQQTLADLEHKEKWFTSERLQRDTHSNGLTLGQNALTNISQVTFSSPKLNYKPKPNTKCTLFVNCKCKCFCFL